MLQVPGVRSNPRLGHALAAFVDSEASLQPQPTRVPSGFFRHGRPSENASVVDASAKVSWIHPSGEVKRVTLHRLGAVLQ